MVAVRSIMGNRMSRCDGGVSGVSMSVVSSANDKNGEITGNGVYWNTLNLEHRQRIISEGECDLPVYDDSSPKKDEVLNDIISIPPGNGNDHFIAESSAIESVLNRDNMISSPKIDLPIQEFASELALIAPIPPGIVKADLDPKGDIRFIENLMCDNSFPRPSETLKDDSETVIDSNNDYSSSNGDSYEDIDYVDASPPHFELVSLEEVKDFHPEDGEIEDDILREKLSKINLLIAKIEALNANPTPSSDFMLKSPIPIEDGDSFLEKFETNPELETFKFDIEEKNSGSTTIHADISLPDLECFYFKSKPDPKSFKRLGNGIVICVVSYISVLFCPVDTAYWYDQIWRIELASASTVVEIDLTWSLGLVSVELASVEAQISLIKLEFSSCIFVNFPINLLRVSSIDCLRSSKSGDLDSSRLSVLKCFLDDQNSHSGSLKDESVLATNRKAQAAKDKAVGKRTHHYASPLIIIILDDVDPTTGGGSLSLESVSYAENNVDYSLNNVEDGTEANSPSVDHSLEPQHSNHFDEYTHVHSGGDGLHHDEGDEQAHRHAFGSFSKCFTIFLSAFSFLFLFA
ncbi:hypothetical protein Tco_1360129 [Tanacetum coccineum]